MHVTEDERISEFVLEQSQLLVPLAGGADMCLTRLWVAVRLYREYRNASRKLRKEPNG